MNASWIIPFIILGGALLTGSPELKKKAQRTLTIL